MDAHELSICFLTLVALGIATKCYYAVSRNPDSPVIPSLVLSSLVYVHHLLQAFQHSILAVRLVQHHLTLASLHDLPAKAQNPSTNVPLNNIFFPFCASKRVVSTFRKQHVVRHLATSRFGGYLTAYHQSNIYLQ